MVGGRLASLAFAAAACLSTVSAATVDPIVIKGSKFFYKTNGTQFFIRGVDYQQNPDSATASTATINDPLADGNGCKRDLPYLQKLRTNTVRVYAINPNVSHDSCMETFGNAGIYVIADLSAPDESINRNSPSWDIDLYNRYTSVVDLLQQYNNVLGFFAGNEVANAANVSSSVAYVKASVRDVKAYIKSKNYRSIPVGYATADDASIRGNIRPYLNCGSEDVSVDMFGYNIYEWCSASTSYTSSGYADRTAEFQNYSVPAFFAEYGCVDPPRLFDDTPALFSDPMDKVWNGGLVYEYFSDAAGYGLATVSGSSVQTNTAFAAYSSKIAKATPSSVNAASYTPTNTALQACPTVDASWQASSNLPPSPNNDLCNCQVSNSTCQANSGVSSDAIGSILNYICGNDPDSCDGISGNATTGVYGAYSMCTAKQQLTIAMNAYFIRSGSNSDSCDFSGNATVTSASVGSSCSSLLSSAGGAFGTGTVSGTGSGSAGSSSSAASALTIPAFDFGILAVGIWTAVATLSGVGIFLL